MKMGGRLVAKKKPKLDRDGAMEIPEFLDRRKDPDRWQAKRAKTTPAPRHRTRPKS